MERALLKPIDNARRCAEEDIALMSKESSRSHVRRANLNAVTLAKHWQVEVRELSSSQVVRAAEVKAAHWMDAIRQVREAMGRAPELPDSASFRFGAKGSVTITVDSEALSMTASSRDGIGEVVTGGRPRRRTAVYAEPPSISSTEPGAEHAGADGPVTAAWSQPPELASMPANVAYALHARGDLPADRTIPSTHLQPGLIDFESEQLRRTATSKAPAGWRLLTAEVVGGDVATPLRLHRLIWFLAATEGLPRICAHLGALRAAVAAAMDTAYPAMLELGVTLSDQSPSAPLIALRWKSWKPRDEWLVLGHHTALVDA